MTYRIDGGALREIAFAFVSAAGGALTTYYGGLYEFAASDNSFSPSTTFGTANSSYGAYFFVVLGAATVDELTITVTGTSVDDEGNRTPADSENIVIPNATVVDTYFETTKHWIGQITIEATAGTAKTCNYGFAEYWDNRDMSFVLEAIHATWLGGANDADADIKVRHHKATGWTFNVGAEPTPPAAVASFATDRSTEDNIKSGEHGSWERTDLATNIDGSGSEGFILEVSTTVANTFRIGNAVITVRPQ